MLFGFVAGRDQHAGAIGGAAMATVAMAKHTESTSGHRFRPERDKWGRRLGTLAAEMDAVLIESGERPISVATVAERTGATPAFAASHMSNLARQQYIVRVERGLYVVNLKRPKSADDRISSLLPFDETGAKTTAAVRGHGFILGHPATRVLNWMGANGFTKEQARRVYDLLMVGYIEWEGSATQAFSDGQNPAYRKPLKLSKAEQAKIRAVANGKSSGAAVAAIAKDDIVDILDDPDLNDTEKVRQVRARLGQDQFRANLIALWRGKCCLTGCATVELLRASHIKPWVKSDDRQKLDKFNGLLLTPNADALFDRGYITFTDDEKLVRSRQLSAAARVLLAGCGKRIDVFAGNKPYLRYHRDNVFRG